MKKRFPFMLNQYRCQVRGYVPTYDGEFNGTYEIPYKGKTLRIMCGIGEGWDHVSVSLRHRCPTWNEMTAVKNLFFDPDELVIQFHPPKKDYVNFYKNVLHLWRPWDQVITLPPTWMLAPPRRG